MSTATPAPESILHETVGLPDSFVIPADIRGNRAAILLLARRQLSAKDYHHVETAFSQINSELKQLDRRLPSITSNILTGCEGSSLQLSEFTENVAGSFQLIPKSRKRGAR